MQLDECEIKSYNQHLIILYIQQLLHAASPSLANLGQVACFRTHNYIELFCISFTACNFNEIKESHGLWSSHCVLIFAVEVIIEFLKEYFEIF